MRPRSVCNLDALFTPRAFALSGASNQPGSIGDVLATDLFGAGFHHVHNLSSIDDLRLRFFGASRAMPAAWPRLPPDDRDP